MKVTLRALKSITPYERNPRNNDAAVDAVARSIEEFGFRQPIVVDEQMVIIAGHTRYKAALKLGLDKVPVHVATGLSDEQVRAYRLADNMSRESAQKPAEPAVDAIQVSSRIGRKILDLTATVASCSPPINLSRRTKAPFCR